MSAKGMEAFIEKMRADDRLAEEFAIVVTDSARTAGFSFREAEVRELFLNDASVSRQLAMFLNTVKAGIIGSEDLFKSIAAMARSGGVEVTEGEVKTFIAEKPVGRALSGREGMMTTMMVGEEGGKPPRKPKTPPAADQDGADDSRRGGASTMALGEEGSPFAHITPDMWKEILERDKKNPKPLEDKHQGGVSTMAVGEEDGPLVPPSRPQPQPTTEALGEEDVKPRMRSTMAIGEEDKKPRPPKP